MDQPAITVPACGTGHVRISLDDGKVTLTDCTADEGARAFWDAIEKSYGLGPSATRPGFGATGLPAAGAGSPR
jgi:hypothetical protein